MANARGQTTKCSLYAINNSGGNRGNLRFEAHHIHLDVVECREVVVGKFVEVARSCSNGHTGRARRGGVQEACSLDTQSLLTEVGGGRRRGVGWLKHP